ACPSECHAGQETIGQRGIMPLLKISQLKKGFNGPNCSNQMVINIESFALDEKAQLALEGESGSGNTTFLNLIAGILRPDSGDIDLAGQQMSSLPEPAPDRLRARTIGYIFQVFNLLQGYTRLENILLGMSLRPGVDRPFGQELLQRLDSANAREVKEP
ncbi:MAG: ATP-binding cassette domain-containing protein, partial [Limisphaerales bacterium]